MRIALINPPASSIFDWLNLKKSYLKIFKVAYLTPEQYSSFIGEPLGLQYLASSLRKADYQTDIFDFHLEEKIYNCTFLKGLKKLIPLGKYSLIGITGSEAFFQEVLGIVKQIKKEKPSIHITYGGYHATTCYKEILKNFTAIDSIILGEGEKPIIELAHHLKDNKIKKLPSFIATRQNLNQSLRPYVHSNLEKIPLPARDYSSKAIKKNMALGISSSRGCHYGVCSFCIFPTFYGNKNWRCRRPESIIKEIEFLKRKFNFRRLTFSDENFLGWSPEGKERATKIARLLIKKKIKINWMIDCRIDEVDKEIFRLLKLAGLKSVFIGIEFPCQKMLSNYKKGINKEKTIKTLEILNQLKIKINPGMIFFTPEIDLETLEKNYQFASHLEHYDVFFSTRRLIVLPHTPLSYQLEKDWQFADPRVNQLYTLLLWAAKIILQKISQLPNERRSANKNLIKKIHYDFIFGAIKILKKYNYFPMLDKTLKDNFKKKISFLN